MIQDDCIANRRPPRRSYPPRPASRQSSVVYWPLTLLQPRARRTDVARRFQNVNFFSRPPFFTARHRQSRWRRAVRETETRCNLRRDLYWRSARPLTEGGSREVLLAVLRLRVVEWLLRLVERVAAFVLLPHPVDDEHRQEDGAEQAHDGTPDDPWNRGYKPWIQQAHDRNPDDPWNHNYN